MSSTPSLPDLQPIGREAMAEVLEILLSLSATEVNPAISVEPELTIETTIQLIGNLLSGEVRLLVPREFAEWAVSTLVKSDRQTSDVEVHDFCGELGNMVAGRVAERLGREDYPCTLSIPRVALATRAQRSPESATTSVRIVWKCHNHQLTLEIDSRPGSL